MLMRRMICGAVMIIASGLGCFGQQTGAEKERWVHNVFLEFLGSPNIISVSYDTRFPGTKVWGWRAGLGFSSAPIESELGYKPGVSLPLGVNGLFGSRASKFELGLVVAPGGYFYRDREYYYEVGEDYCFSSSYPVGPTKYHFGCSFGIDLGYRLQRRNGFAFRVGLLPSVFVNSHGGFFNVFGAFPYVGFGYTFR